MTGKVKINLLSSPFYTTERQVTDLGPTWGTEQSSQWWQLFETEKFTLTENIQMWTHLISFQVECRALLKRMLKHPPKLERELKSKGSSHGLTLPHPRSGQQWMTLGFRDCRRQPVTYLSHVLRWYKGTGCLSSSGRQQGGHDPPLTCRGQWPGTDPERNAELQLQVQGRAWGAEKYFHLLPTGIRSGVNLDQSQTLWYQG